MPMSLIKLCFIRLKVATSRKIGEIMSIIFSKLKFEIFMNKICMPIDSLLILKSNIHDKLHRLWKAAMLTHNAAKGLTTFYSHETFRSFIICALDNTSSWVVGQVLVHPITGENYSHAKIVVYNFVH